MKDKGAPVAGGGVALSSTATAQLAADLPVHEQRWDSKLPPDMARGAAEIYRSIRADGVSNMREWLNNIFSEWERQQMGHEWTTLWNMASEIDFEVARVPPAQVPTMLNTSDAMEIKLRYLAASRHYWRTGDEIAFNRMLAIKPPGVGSDVAPSWMIADATLYSKTEYQRNQRVWGRGRGRGKGKGKKGPKGGGRGDKPAGPKGGQQA